jgi:predicted DNA repair protein MutK
VSLGLIALLDDVAAIAKVAAATLDDVAGQAARAGVKSAGVVIDDAAVTPRYVVGFAAQRELPIIGRIALGSLKNKLLFLLPAALLLAAFAPWAITPLLMLGGAYLCYEGAEKVHEWLWPHAHVEAAQPEVTATDAQALEDSKVRSAVRTDFILSAEIMAIALAALPEGPVATTALILALVGVGITGLVYGAVALIVKADDIGLVLAQRQGQGIGPATTRWLGRALVQGMPGFLAALATLGTAAMLWVGGGIVLHGLGVFGLHAPEHAIEAVSHAVADVAPVLPSVLGWLSGAALSGLFGWGLGAAVMRGVAAVTGKHVP